VEKLTNTTYISGGQKIHVHRLSLSLIPQKLTSSVLSQQKVYGPFFFAEATVTGNTYKDMLENWLFLQLANDSNDCIFCQDGVPPNSMAM
jgi:hypothetical protein